MRSNLGFIASRIPLNLAESGTDVRLTWQQWPEGTTVDPVTEAKVADETHQPVTRQQVSKAFVHFPAPGSSGSSTVRQFQEIEVGDCIVDFAADTTLPSGPLVDGLYFELLDRNGVVIGGQKWVAKPISARLAVSWMAVMQGVQLWRPLLLRKAT